MDPVEVFRGIPYAAPPVGELRFRAPISPIPWNGVKLADTFGAVCPQNYPDLTNDTAALLQMPHGRYQQLKKMIVFLANQSEDCLFLNLYIPGSGKRIYNVYNIIFNIKRMYTYCYDWTSEADKKTNFSIFLSLTS